MITFSPGATKSRLGPRGKAAELIGRIHRADVVNQMIDMTISVGRAIVADGAGDEDAIIVEGLQLRKDLRFVHAAREVEIIDGDDVEFGAIGFDEVEGFFRLGSTVRGAGR